AVVGAAGEEHAQPLSLARVQLDRQPTCRPEPPEVALTADGVSRHDGLQRPAPGPPATPPGCWRRGRSADPGRRRAVPPHPVVVPLPPVPPEGSAVHHGPGGGAARPEPPVAWHRWLAAAAARRRQAAARHRSVPPTPHP